MKRQIKLTSRYKPVHFLCIAIICFLSYSCESEFRVPDDNFTSAPPVITSVSEVKEDKAVTQGVLDNTYIIRGENLASLVAVYFNNVKGSFNPALLTDKIAFVVVPEDVPVIDVDPNDEIVVNNKMRLENLFGTVEYDFSLLDIEDFTEATVNGKKVVNITGGDFSETTSVTFTSGSEDAGNLVEREANFTIISAGEIEAEVPAGVEQAFIFVETAGGAIAKSESYGFSYSIYIDALNADWRTTEWGGTHELASNEQALGDFAIKSTREAWAGLTFLAENATIKYDDFNDIVVSIYGSSTGPAERVRLALNDFDTQVELELVTGEWTKFVIPLSDFYPNGGAPDEIFRIDIQEASNTGQSQYIFFVDDFGFL